jgi:hypothetical protein
MTRSDTSEVRSEHRLVRRRCDNSFNRPPLTLSHPRLPIFFVWRDRGPELALQG